MVMRPSPSPETTGLPGNFMNNFGPEMSQTVLAYNHYPMITSPEANSAGLPVQDNFYIAGESLADCGPRTDLTTGRTPSPPPARRSATYPTSGIPNASVSGHQSYSPVMETAAGNVGHDGDLEARIRHGSGLEYESLVRLREERELQRDGHPAAGRGGKAPINRANTPEQRIPSPGTRAVRKSDGMPKPGSRHNRNHSGRFDKRKDRQNAAMPPPRKERSSPVAFSPGGNGARNPRSPAMTGPAYFNAPGSSPAPKDIFYDDFGNILPHMEYMDRSRYHPEPSLEESKFSYRPANPSAVYDMDGNRLVEQEWQHDLEMQDADLPSPSANGQTLPHYGASLNPWGQNNFRS